jgi:hypothetical protein
MGTERFQRISFAWYVRLRLRAELGTGFQLVGDAASGVEW